MRLEKVKINDLIFPSYNPRKKLKKGDSEYEKIKNSIKNFGYVDPVIINKDNVIIGGNQRCKVMKDLGYKDIEAIVVNVEKGKEKALNIALNKISGEWDFEKLSNLLNEIKINNKDDFFLTGFDESEFERMSNQLDQGMTLNNNDYNNQNYNNQDYNNQNYNSDNQQQDNQRPDLPESSYTRKIEIPIYSPKKEKQPELEELYKKDKTNKLIEKINKLKIDKELKDFLLHSAYRFTMINYENVAEYYSHLKDKNIKNIFQELALVIIDFNKAIEYGFGEFNNKMIERMKQEGVENE